MIRKIAGTLLCLLLICISVFAFADVTINKTNFPDTNFRKYISNYVDWNSDGTLSNDEITGMISIDCREMEISDLSGIEFFTDLTILICENNQLVKLDLSKNQDLESIDCSGNQLTSLDFHDHPQLWNIDCSNNHLKSLKLGKKTKLVNLICHENNLSALNLSGCPILETLNCTSNSLKSLDLSACNHLVSPLLDLNPVTSLKLGYQSELDSLQLVGLSKLKTLDISQCPKLKSLYIVGAKQLAELDLTKSSPIECLVLQDTGVHTLRLGSKPHLIELVLIEDPNLRAVDISGCPKLIQLMNNVQPLLLEGYKEWIIPETNDSPRWWLYIRDNYVNLITNKTAVTAVSLDNANATLIRTAKKPQPTIKLKSTVSPADATDPSVKWSSSNKKVATVDENGKVTVLKAGKVTITCTANDGSGIKATCKITVKNKLVNSITLKKKSITLKAGKVYQLEVKSVKPSTAVNKKVKWSTSDKKVATVDKNGKVTAKKKGTCVITCTAKDGSKVFATCKVTVK